MAPLLMLGWIPQSAGEAESRFLVIGFGVEGAPSVVQALEELAAAGNGQLYTARDSSELRAILASFVVSSPGPVLASGEEEGEQFLMWAAILLATVFALALALAVAVGRRRRLVAAPAVEGGHAHG
jgi:hypothetical protein